MPIVLGLERPPRMSLSVALSGLSSRQRFFQHQVGLTLGQTTAEYWSRASRIQSVSSRLSCPAISNCPPDYMLYPRPTIALRSKARPRWIRIDASCQLAEKPLRHIKTNSFLGNKTYAVILIIWPRYDNRECLNCLFTIAGTWRFLD